MNNSLDDMPSGDTLIDYTSLGPTEPPRPFDPAQELERQGIKVSQAKDAVWSDATTTDQKSPQKKAAKVSHGYDQGSFFEMKANGLWHVQYKDDDGEPNRTWLSATFKVLGKTRDSDSNSWGLFLKWQDPDNKEHTWAMPLSLLSGRDNSALVERLLDEGLHVNTNSTAKGRLVAYLLGVQCDHSLLCVNKVGWHGDAFVFPDTTIAKQEDDAEQVVLQSNSTANPYKVNGCLEDWQNTLGTYARGNSRLALALGASLSAPLLYQLGFDGGGFNFVGASSTGKTTALCLGASVWGKGTPREYIQSWRATDNGLEGVACMHNDTCLCLDELGQCPSRVVNEAVYMLANGRGKNRANKNGAVRQAMSWNTMLVSTGEKGLSEKLGEDGKKPQAGQAVRFVDVSADAGAGLGIFEDIHGFESASVFADTIKKVAREQHGHLARCFIEKIQDNLDDLKSISASFKNVLAFYLPPKQSGPIDGQVQRVARLFALAGVALELAIEWAFLPWQKEEGFTLTKRCFDDWLMARGGSGSHEEKAMLEQVMLFLEQHGQSRFQDIEKPDVLCVNRVGYKWHTDQGTEYYILPESFKAEVCKGMNSKRAAKVLDEKGLLVRDSDGKLQKKVSLPNLGRPRCYVVRMDSDTNSD